MSEREDNYNTATYILLFLHSSSLPYIFKWFMHVFLQNIFIHTQNLHNPTLPSTPYLFDSPKHLNPPLLYTYTLHLLNYPKHLVSALPSTSHSFNSPNPMNSPSAMISCITKLHCKLISIMLLLFLTKSKVNEEFT